ncbi:hypothetical protein [Streptomyces sp. NPDC096339]|uniref:hypothetical protein n=1 Tax=Streptomyces sp. NPDC096339 TaxID=3366086 RepID=UPI00382E51D6
MFEHEAGARFHHRRGPALIDKPIGKKPYFEADPDPTRSAQRVRPWGRTVFEAYG